MLFEQLKALREEMGFECSDSVVAKAQKILELKRIKPCGKWEHQERFHVCPDETTEKGEGYGIDYYDNKDIWTCTCRAISSFRGARWEKVCSHILAACMLRRMLDVEGAKEGL